jgi:MFS transporter, DHA1 family, quinolone resistance protein
MMTVRSIERRYALILFLFWFSTALPMSLFILLAQARGMSLGEVGVLSAIYSATIFLLEVPTGGLADAWGRRRVALLGEVMTLAGWGTFLISFTFPAFLVAFILNGLGRTLASGTLDAWFVDSLHAIDPNIDLHPRLSRTGAVTFVALGLGAVCGGAIAHVFAFLPPDGTAILTPLATPGLAAIAVRFGLVLAIAWLVEEPSDPNRARSWRHGLTSVPPLLRDAVRLTMQNRILLRLLAVAAASGLVLNSVEMLWQPRFGQLLGLGDMRSVYLGMILAGSFLMGVVGNLIAPRLSKRLGHRPGRVCAIFHGFRGAMLVALAAQGHAVPAAILFWLVYLGQGAVSSTHVLLLNEEIPAQRRSAMLSIESLVSYAGGFVGGAGLGFVAEHTSIPIAWGFAGGLLLVSWVLYWRVDSVREERKRERQLLEAQTVSATDTG